MKILHNMTMLFLGALVSAAITSCGGDNEDGGSENPSQKSDCQTLSAEVNDDLTVVLKGYANGATGNVGFCYSSTNKSPMPETDITAKTTTVMSNGTYEVKIRVSRSTTYYYRAFIEKNGLTVVANEIKSFITPEAKENGHDWVDLGLSVRWATCNVGATKPEEYGDYYAWGETKTKNTYTGETYTYKSNPEVLPLSADVAHVKWGGKWRMPTRDEMEELIENCKWTWTTQNGVNGYIVSSTKNGNSDSIFLPATGTGVILSGPHVGSGGEYWSSSIHMTDGAYRLIFQPGFFGCGRDIRSDGRSVRPVFSE